MHNEIKQAINNGKGSDLRYFFVDSLDIDPSFASYQEDFDYCLKHTVFDYHRELTPFCNNKADWNKDYWLKLKVDLQENFSVERMRHMIAVAKVIYKDKIKQSRLNNTIVESPAETKINYLDNHEKKVYPVEYLQPKDDPEVQQRIKTKKEIEEFNREEEARRKRLIKKTANSQISTGTYTPKKTKGVPWRTIIAGAAVGLLLILLMTRR